MTISKLIFLFYLYHNMCPLKIAPPPRHLGLDPPLAGCRYSADRRRHAMIRTLVFLPTHTFRLTRVPYFHYYSFVLFLLVFFRRYHNHRAGYCVINARACVYSRRKPVFVILLWCRDHNDCINIRNEFRRKRLISFDYLLLNVFTNLFFDILKCVLWDWDTRFFFRDRFHATRFVYAVVP